MGSGFQGESGGLTGESVLPGADREEGQQPCEHRNVQQSNIKLQKATWKLNCVAVDRVHGAEGRAPPEVPWGQKT